MSASPITVDEARAALDANIPRLDSELLALDDCLGRIAAEDVRAAEEVPPFDNSAMDGYAVRSVDLERAGASEPVRLEVVDESRAGHPADRGPEPGEAVAISTGAEMPAGADAVVPVERVSPEVPADREGTGEGCGHPPVIVVEGTVESGSHVRRVGDDVRLGDLVIEAGTRLGPAELGSLASIGVSSLACSRRPRLALLATGDELVRPGSDLGAGQIRDTSSYSIAAMARLAGAEVLLRENVADRRDATRAALLRALECDIVAICGGVSVGRHDHVKDVLDSLGVRQIFWRVAMRPGGPTWFGVAQEEVGKGNLVFGLPGNPVSALVTFHLFARRAIARCQGAQPATRCLTARLGAERETPRGRAEYLRCRLEERPEGLTAVPTRTEQSSHVLTSLIGAEGLAVLPAERDHIGAGEMVTVELL